MCTPLSTFPAGGTCGILGDPPSANFFISDTNVAQYLTPDGCANLCTATATCLAFLVGDGLCALYDATQANNGFVVDSNSAFTGYDLDCFNCQIITTTATSSTVTSSTQPSATCIPPAGAICNTVGDFPGNPAPFIIGQSTNPQDTTLAGCSALCSITAGCLSWDLGGGSCFILNADQTDSGFVADPNGAFEGSDAACLHCVTSSSLAPSSATSTQPSATSSTQPSATCIPPAGAICNTVGDFPGNPAPFIIEQSTNPQDTTLAGCSALCTITVGCLSWDIGGGTCFILNADQTDSGFVADPNGAFEGSDAACLLCVTSSSSAQLSTTSSAQLPTEPSSTQVSSSASYSTVCILPPTAVCGVFGFVSIDSGFISDFTDPQYQTIQGCANLCSTTTICQSFRLGQGVCQLWSTSQASAGFTPDPQSGLESFDLDCFTCVSSSTSSLALPSSAVPPVTSTSAFAFSAAAASALSGSSPVSPGTQGGSVPTSTALALSIIGQSGVQTPILSASTFPAAPLSVTISAATALALSIPGQSSVPIAVLSASISQASLKYSNYSVSIGSFNGAMPTPSAIASVTPGAVISSATTLPSAIPFVGFLRVINPVLPAKRQLHRISFLKVNIDGTVSTTRSCSSASIFSLGTNGQLTSNGLTAFATTGDVAAGISDFTFGLENPVNIETTFALPGDILEWNNNAFIGNQAIFAFPPTPPFVVNAIFDGVLPDGYTERSFQGLPLGSVAAADGTYKISARLPMLMQNSWMWCV
jgi:hypothetical protein